MHKTVLLTSVGRPRGPKFGDAPSVGYELLHRQVTRAQGLFSLRPVNVFFSLDYIAENLTADFCTVLGLEQAPGVAMLVTIHGVVKVLEC